MAEVFDNLGKIDKKYGEQNRRIAKFLKNNKGKISKGHHKKLVAKMKANHKAADPVDPSTGAKIRDINKEARGATTGKYSTAWKNLQGSVAGEEKALSNLPSYMDKRFDDMTKLGAQQAAAAQAIQQQLAQSQAGVEQQTQGFRDQLNAEAAGNPLMASSKQAAQDASAGRTATAASQGANIAAIGAISQSTSAGQAQNIRKEQAEKTDEYRGRIAKLKTDQSDLAKEIGQDFIAQKSNILSGIGDRQVKAAAVAASAADDAADNALAKEKLAETKRNNKANNKTADKNAESNRIRAEKAGKGSGTASKPMKAKTNGENVSKISAAVKAYKTGATTLQLTGDLLAQYVKKQAGVEPSSTHAKVAHWAAFNPTNKKRRNELVKLLHSEGYTIKGTDLDKYF